MHWLPAVETVEVAVTLVIPQLPVSSDLYFWALQASFAGPEGVSGGAHLGLQWHAGHPGGTAANWGGYASDGSILGGTDSDLSSATANPHTRDFEWTAGSRYRLTITRDLGLGSGWWAGSISDMGEGTTRVIRSLYSTGDRLTSVMVWTEAFCRCEAPPAAAIWSDPRTILIDGSESRPSSARLTYQSEANGGCSNSDSYVLPHGIAQVTGVTRTNQDQAVLEWS
jgi:hypothetical protein